jgi:hypothetical protein
VKFEREGLEVDELQRGQVLEERIRGRGGEYRLAGIREELEEEGVCLARGGGQDQVVDITAEVPGHRFARAAETARIGIVSAARTARECVAECVERIFDPGPCRIRLRQVE